jgi:hypothetical protein
LVFANTLSHLLITIFSSIVMAIPIPPPDPPPPIGYAESMREVRGIVLDG